MDQRPTDALRRLYDLADNAHRAEMLTHGLLNTRCKLFPISPKDGSRIYRVRCLLCGFERDETLMEMVNRYVRTSKDY